MKINANALKDKQEVIADVCIIGAGPAGMTTALEFLQSDLNVAVFRKWRSSILWNGPMER